MSDDFSEIEYYDNGTFKKDGVNVTLKKNEIGNTDVTLSSTAKVMTLKINSMPYGLPSYGSSDGRPGTCLFYSYVNGRHTYGFSDTQYAMSYSGILTENGFIFDKQDSEYVKDNISVRIEFPDDNNMRVDIIVRGIESE